MAAFRCKHEALVSVFGNKLLLYKNGEEKVLEIPTGCKEDNTDEEKKTRKDVKKTDASNCVLAATFSDSGKYFAVGDNNKQLHLYAVSTEWKLISTRSLARRCTTLAFTHGEREVVVADRTGDVYRYPVAEPNEAGTLLLGHLSMVLDLVLTDDDKFIITCDRDEKVRVSHFPNAYNIHTFCLLHTDYVSQVLYVDQLKCLMSGSGDGKIAMWSLDGSLHATISEDVMSVGNQQQEVETCEPLAVKRMVFDSHNKFLAVIYSRSRKLCLFHLQSENGKVGVGGKQEVELPAEPWDICFDSQHRLWVLQGCENDAVAVYTCQRSGNQIQVMKSQNEDSVKQIVDKLNGKWDLLKSAVDWRTEFISLTKAKNFDNVQKYLKKKEERLRGVKPVVEEPPEKKLKSSG